MRINKPSKSNSGVKQNRGTKAGNRPSPKLEPKWEGKAGPQRKLAPQEKIQHQAKPVFVPKANSQGRGPVQAGSKKKNPSTQGENKPSPALLSELLKLHGVPQPIAVVEKLWAFHQFLRKHNEDKDLTRLIGFSTVVQRHYADCLILQKWYAKKWPTPLVDIGSGAGFPGLILKMTSPEVPMILSEPRPRRVDFLNAAIKHLGLKDIEVFGHKFTSRSFTQKVGGIITRAFETVDKTLPRLMNAIPVGGKAIFMKGPKGEEEILAVSNPDWNLTRKLAYRIENTTLDRMVLEYTRTQISQKVAPDWEDEDVAGTGEVEE
jgi:16S rRNA (guanine527-N7)-methyltransferase